MGTATPESWAHAMAGRRVGLDQPPACMVARLVTPATTGPSLFLHISRIYELREAGGGGERMPRGVGL